MQEYDEIFNQPPTMKLLLLQHLPRTKHESKSNIIGKVVENPLKHKLALPHETLQSDRSLTSDDDEEAQDGPLKEDIYVDKLANWRSNRRLATDTVDQSETLYSPKTCAICLEIYKVSDTICWSASNEACHHAYHLDCMMDWLMENDECPLCRENYLEASA
eukprot:scaffold3039_cov171-Chaetoceros_neogracile.AAC.2